eukprot:snap_masked-scaffold557_size137338-processed-gene-0.1 protein:Tk03362 transcript:snap_masked-scaffold557_size137338-processed-gene-0.1-mRNA-1 annotation:"leucine-rich repeat neuronal protein 2"
MMRRRIRSRSGTTTLLFLGLLSLLEQSLVQGGICPSQCQCNDELLTAICSQGQLKVVPIFLNPQIKSLDASENQIHKLENGLHFYEDLERLDLSRNSFKHIGQGQFVNQAKLQRLNLSNNFLTSLHANSFQGPSALHILDLSHNILTSLPNKTFAGLDSLLELKLHHNQLQAIEHGAFEGLQSLRVLELEHNQLQTVRPEWLSPMRSLRFLYAAHNSLGELPDDAFKSLTALRVITFRENRLSSSNISQYAFRGCRGVDTLDLSRNLLHSVPNRALSQLPKLNHLDLSGNPLGSLDRGSFQSLFELEVLYLNNMSQLETLGGHTFIDNMKLRELQMEHNSQLSPLPWGIFSSNALLESYSVRNNSWATLSPYQIPQPSLKSLFLEGLPLHCNCSVTWLWEIYQRGPNSSLYVDQVRCSWISGSAANGQKGGQVGDPLSRMTIDQLACADWTQVLIIISLSIIVTVLVLVFAAVLIYKFRQCRMEAKYGGTMLHIKDDTMIYKAALHSSSSASYASSSEPTYKAVSAVGYSPTGHHRLEPLPGTEPFYEVPKYANPHEVQFNEAKYASSGGLVGSELWEEPDYFASQQGHCYTNPRLMQPAHASQYQNFHGSPQSTSTGVSSMGSSSNASSTASSHGTKPMMFSSPATARLHNQNTPLHNTLAYHPQQQSQQPQQQQQQSPMKFFSGTYHHQNPRHQHPILESPLQHSPNESPIKSHANTPVPNHKRPNNASKQKSRSAKAPMMQPNLYV